jgi:hypothetical protein
MLDRAVEQQVEVAARDGAIYSLGLSLAGWQRVFGSGRGRVEWDCPGEISRAPGVRAVAAPVRGRSIELQWIP